MGQKFSKNYFDNIIYEYYEVYYEKDKSVQLKKEFKLVRFIKKQQIKYLKKYCYLCQKMSNNNLAKYNQCIDCGYFHCVLHKIKYHNQDQDYDIYYSNIE